MQLLAQPGRIGSRTLQAVVALIGVHALHPHQVRSLTLDHIDLANHKIDLDHGHRRLGAFTAAALTDYLHHRRHVGPTPETRTYC